MKVHILEGHTSTGRLVFRCDRGAAGWQKNYVGRAQPARFAEVTCKDCLARSAPPEPGDVVIPMRARR